MRARAAALSARDRAVIRLVAYFRQLTALHLQTLLFHDITSRTPVHRTLRRLTDLGYLQRIEHRLVGGSRGGSGQYVYQLGSRGFYMHGEGKWRPWRTVNYHALAIADCYVAIRQFERAGQLRVLGFSCEPDCWVTIGRSELKPDLRVDVERPGQARTLFWLEIDMATEGQKQLRGKLESYWRAYNDADVAEWPVFPLVLWVVVDAERERELCWLIEQLPEQARALFRVCQLDTLSTGLGL